MSHRLVTLAAVFALPICGQAFARGAIEGYLTDSAGAVVRNSTGLCWRTAHWTPAMARPECDAELGKRAEAPRLAAAVERPVLAEPAAAAPPPEPAKGEVYPLWYATNRKPLDPKEEKKGYSDATDSRVHYGKVFVDVPQDFLKELSSPSWLMKLRLKSAETLLKVRAPMPLSAQDFVADIRDEFKAMPPSERLALVYIHGFKTTFVEAAQRAAGIGYQLKIPVTAFFSWPSKGEVAAYLADSQAVQRSEEAIARFLVKFVRESRATKVHLVAHSMGNYGLLRAMLRPFMQAALRKGVRFGQIILAAPDVDTDVFVRDAPRYVRAADRVTVYASSKDHALSLSKELSDFPRAGLIPPVVLVKGIDTIDVGPVNLSVLGHSYIAEEMPVLQDMHALIRRNSPPSKRSHIEPAGSHWVLK